MNRIRSRKKTGYQFAYLFSFVAVCVAYFFRRYEFSSNFHINLSLVAIVSSFIIYLWHIKRSGWSSETLLAGLSACIFLIALPFETYALSSTTDFSMIAFFLLSTSVDKTDSRLLERLFYFKLLGATIVLFFYCAHLLPDVVMVRPDSDMVRHSYGFMHPNSFGMYMTSIAFDFVLMNQKWQLKKLIPLLFLSFLTYSITNSRTSLLILLFTIFCYLMKPILVKWTVDSKILILMVGLSFIVGIMLPYFYKMDNSIYDLLNRLLSRRLEIGHLYFERFGFSLFPRDIGIVNEFNGRYLYNDSFYVDSILHQGILLFLLYPILIYVQLFRKRMNLFYAALFLSTFLISMLEGHGASICTCSILLIPYFTTNSGNAGGDTVYTDR